MKYSVNELRKMAENASSKIQQIKTDINEYSTFQCATIENVEDVRPNFDVFKALEEIDSLHEERRKIKHAVNLFNTTYVLKDFNMTIDQALVYMPQLKADCYRAQTLASTPQKKRVNVSSNLSYIDYEYANFDVKKAAEILKETNRKVVKLQVALDEVNSQKLIEIDL